jgi:hypothetical protein
MWATRFPKPDKIKFFVLVKGNCWLYIDGEQAPVRVEAGDVFLLSAQRSSALARLVGYMSESAFSNAFKRVIGKAPKHYRSAVRAYGSVGKRASKWRAVDGAGSFGSGRAFAGTKGS